MNNTKMKLSFSQRKGLEPLPTAQTEEWNNPTTIEIWDAIVDFFEYAISRPGGHQFLDVSMRSISLELLFQTRKNYDDIFDLRYHVCEQEFFDEIRNLLEKSAYWEYYSKASWNKRLEFIEMFVTGNRRPELVDAVSKRLNAVFEKRMVAYRIINGQITDIDNEEERAAVEEAAQESSHITKAAKLLYDRKNPDPQNSIKESISAVEDICKQITKKEKATLSGCLSEIEKKMTMHSTFKEALTKLYAYTSDEKGIRHSGLSDGEVGHAEAKFMLVTCSAFCNYLREKQASTTEK